jgi:hypothetical protein
LTEQTREYIAKEIERAPDKRFRRQRSDNLDVREADRLLLYRVYSTKVEIALQKFGVDADDDELFGGFDKISDPEALDYLAVNYGLVITEDELGNALRRSNPGIFDPRGPRRRLKSFLKNMDP